MNPDNQQSGGAEEGRSQQDAAQPSQSSPHRPIFGRGDFLEEDPFGLPFTSAEMGNEVEFDLDQLEPKMRSIGIVLPAQSVHGGGLPRSSIHSTFRGGILGYGDDEEGLVIPPSSSATTAYGEDVRKHSYQGRASSSPSSFKKAEPASNVVTPFTTVTSPLSLERPCLVPSCSVPTSSSSSSSAATRAFIPTPAQMKTTRLEEGIVLEPPGLPFDMSFFPLEKCHYYSEKKPEILYTEIEDGLQEKNVSFDFNASKFKFICEYFAGYNIIKFVVRGYRVPDGRIVVEFQRRAGCCMVCAKIVDAIRSVLAPSSSSEASSKEAFSPKGFKAGLTEPLLCSKNSSLVNNPPCAEAAVVQKKLEELRCCLSNSQEDVLTEFCKVLIPLSQLCPDYLSSDLGYADLVCRLAQGYTGTIRLAAISCVANLAASSLKKDKEEESQCESEWFARVLESVVMALSTDENVLVRREAARALMYMSDKFSSDIIRAGGLAALRKYSDDGSMMKADRTLHGYVQAAVQNITVC